STIKLNKLFKKPLIGDVNICIENEKWPKADDGTLLLPVIQIKIFDLPFIPKYLVNIKYIVIFIYPEDMEKVHGDKNGLCIIVYNDENLKLLRKPKIIKSNPRLIKFNNIIDFPSYDDLPQKILEYKELLY
ncbi:MAG: hypothetical protein LN589_03820, partial [Rickettsia endosymbiont of Eriopis connexa]|nr:hypothetical protein [Rickettsia endosymbiont of Eriopis connexa]